MRSTGHASAGMRTLGRSFSCWKRRPPGGRYNPPLHVTAAAERLLRFEWSSARPRPVNGRYVMPQQQLDYRTPSSRRSPLGERWKCAAGVGVGVGAAVTLPAVLLAV